MSEQEKPLRVPEEELNLIRSVFSGSENLLKATRAVLLGLSPTNDEKELVRSTYSNDAVYKIIETRLYPTLSKDSPIGQVQDVWMGVEQMIFGQSRDTIYQSVHYKNEALKLTRKGLNLLRDPEGEPIDVSFDLGRVVNDDLQINLLARIQYIRHIESQLNMLWIISNQKESTAKELKKNSNE